MEDKHTTKPGSVAALLRKTERTEKARTRKEAFQQEWKETRERLLQENQRLHQENESALKRLQHMSKRFEQLRDYTETLRSWLAEQQNSGQANRSETQGEA